MQQPSTALIHDPYTPPDGFVAPQPGVFKASTVIFPNVAAMRQRRWQDKSGYTYGLHGTPTTFLLEERIALLEGGDFCTLAPSGLAAIAMVNLALLKSGDQVLLPENIYGPNLAMARGLLADMGIAHATYDPMDPDTLAAVLGDATRLVWLEAPGSVTMEFPPLDVLVDMARSAGAVTALDNTWGAGLALHGFQLPQGKNEVAGVDVVMQALTKYPSGGGDVLMGSIVTRNSALHARIQRAHMQLGIGVGGNDVEAILRSLPSLPLRYSAQSDAGLALARWWTSRPEVAVVLHPALAGSPGHDNWQRLASGAGAGLFSVVFDERYPADAIDAFVDALKLFKIGYSWGGPISLVVPYDLHGMREKPRWRGTLVRFSIGLENTDDLTADLEQALALLPRPE